MHDEQPQPSCSWTDLLVRAQAGDRAALDQLIAAITLWLLSLLRHFAGALSLEDIEDALQDTIVLVLRHLTAFDPDKGNAPAWLAKIARNRAISILRARRLITGLEFEVLDTCRDPARIVADREERDLQTRRVEAFLNAEGEDFRRAWDLIVLQGKTYAEAAEALGVPPGTLGSRINRGKLKLRKTLVAR